MNTEQKKLKNNKKLRIFILFILLSLLLWMLIKLSREYTSSASISINYKDLPKNKLLQSKATDVIKVRLKSIGFNLLKNKVFKKSIDLSLKNVKRNRGSVYYYTSKDIIPLIEEEFSKSELIAIEPDTLYFDLGKSISKKLKVIPNLNIQYQTGYNLLGQLKIQPEFITIKGPKSKVDSIQSISTELLELNNVHESIDRKVKLAISNNFDMVEYSDKEVMIQGDVEKFTERTIVSKIRILNRPSSYKIITFPKEVELVFQIGLSDFNKINEKDFQVICDYNESLNNNLDYLIPRITKKSSMVKDVKIIPNKIEFLLEK